MEAANVAQDGCEEKSKTKPINDAKNYDDSKLFRNCWSGLSVQLSVNNVQCL